MRFLLVTPLRPATARAQASCHSQAPDVAERKVWVSRVDSTAVLLEQRWTALEPEDIQVALEDFRQCAPKSADKANESIAPRDPEGFTGSDFSGIRIDKIAQCCVGSYLYLAMEVLVPAALVPCPNTGKNMKTSDLERSLSTYACEVCSARFPDYEPLWTARYALLESGEEIRADWLSSHSQEIKLSPLSMPNEVDYFAATLGWGNGFAVNWSAQTQDVRHEFVHGVIDAQHIWLSSEDSKDAIDVLNREISAEPRPVNRGRLRLFSENVSEIFLNLGQQELMNDEIYADLQGLRRDVASALLKSWNYERQKRRLGERAAALRDQVDDIATRASQRSMQQTESLLLALSGLTVFDLSLSFISTVYSGDVSEAPGQHVPFSVFSFFRGATSDILLGVTFLVSLIFVVHIMRRRSR